MLFYMYHSTYILDFMLHTLAHSSENTHTHTQNQLQLKIFARHKSHGIILAARTIHQKLFVVVLSVGVITLLVWVDITEYSLT